MKTLMTFIFIALNAICPLIFSSCDTSSPAEDAIPDDQLALTTLSVSDLTCPSCKAKLEGELKAHGIKAEVDIQKSSKNTVLRHPKDMSIAKITQLIVAAGYKVEDEGEEPRFSSEAQQKESILTISGLNCCSDKAKLEKHLLAHNIKAQIDPKKTQANAILKHSESLSLDDIKKIITAAGFKIEN